MQESNRRGYFRVSLHIPLSAQFKVIGYNKNAVNSNSAPIYIVDISAGGVRVHSRLNLPTEELLLLQFQVELFNRKLTLLGKVLRKAALPDGIFEYGVEFILDDHMREQLLAQIHQLSARLRNRQVLASCSFCTEDEMKELYGERA